MKSNDINPDKELAIIEKAKAGDLAAFKRLLETYDKKVLSLAVHIIGNTVDADDIYQEVFIKVFRNISSFKGNCQFYTWLYRITINTALNYKKSKQRHAHLSMNVDVEDKENHWIVLKNSSALKYNDLPYSEQDIAATIDEALNNELTEKERTIFILKYIQRLQINTISEILQIKSNNIKNILHKSKKKLRPKLKDIFDLVSDEI